MKGLISVLRTAYGAYVEVRNEHGRLESSQRFASTGEADDYALFLKQQKRYAGYTLELGHVVTANRKVLGQ